ncbi:MAG: dihydrodipicolinate synthase family protein, partial [Christensenellales bacterium]|nr:dihydrodipicolinate synthase family protein [Christensenellales bacterium]
MSIFKGCATALVTPFSDSGVDYDSLGRLIDFQIENDVSALVILGTTGEAATMSEDEKIDVVKFSVKAADGRVPVIVGSGSNDTKSAVRLSRLFSSLGADALLVVTPFYNKCTQSGLVAHYS